MRLRKQLTLLCCTIMAIVMCGAANVESQSFRAIELSEAALVPMTGPFKWSPDGSSIAFFYKTSLWVTDLEGNRRDLVEIDGLPRGVEWIDNDRLAVGYFKRTGRLNRHYELLGIDAHTGEATPIDSFDYVFGPEGRTAGTKAYAGPFRSIDGRAYYLKLEHTGRTIEVPLGRSAETIKTVVWLDDRNEQYTEDHYNGFREWDGIVYLLNLQGTDSIPIAEKTPLTSYRPSNVSRDLKFVIQDGIVRSIDNSRAIDLSSKITIAVENKLGCGFNYDSFAPNSDRVLFSYSCDARISNHPDSIEYVKTVHQVGLYDIDLDKMYIIDTLTGLADCNAPVFSPSGDKIAFLSQYRLMVLDIGGLE